jgi:hypothetical protein
MRTARIALFSMAALAALSAPARAQDDPWAGVEVLADEAMADMRGGLRVTEDLDIGFGAVITTFADGAPVLTTQLTWTDAGAVVNQIIGSVGQSIDSLPPHARTILGIEGVDSANGVVIADADGVTALMHNITDGALQNIIVNNANGRDLRQNINVTLTLPNFDAMQSRFDLERLGFQINADMQNVLAGS